MREIINQIVTTKQVLSSDLLRKKKERQNLFESQEDHEQARALVQRAATITQERLAVHLSDLVSLALKSVFDIPYKFLAKFVSKRGATECELLFVDEQGNEYQPLQSSGYGAADIASLALRVVFWSLSDLRPVIVMDEPLRFLSKDLMEKASEMLSSLTKELGLQLIIVTHANELALAADKTFTVSQTKGISHITVI